MKVSSDQIKKKKRVSKRNKIAWRKHVDITDIENFLDDQRLDEILGPVSEKPDDELFQIDTTPNKVGLTTRQRKKLKILEPAKCYSALNPQSKVSDPVGKRSSRRLKEQRQEKMITSDVIKAKKLHKLIIKNKQLDKVALSHEDHSSEAKYDLWNTDLTLDGSNIVVDVRNNNWISGDGERHLMYGQGKRPKIVPKNIGKKPLGVNSFEIPHPGMSYNPSFNDHQDLLQKIAEKEKEIMKQEQHISRVTKQMFRKVSPDEKQQDWIEEMSQGIPHLDHSVDNMPEEDYHVEETAISNPPVVNKKKTLKQRRKQKAEQQKEILKKIKMFEKRKTTSIHRLKFLEVHMVKLEKKSKIKQFKKSKKLEVEKTSVKRLGRTKFEEPDMAFNLAKDIAGNLRNIKKEGNLLAERWTSLQKRNLIEVTKIRHNKKGKVKKYTKAGHKEDWKETVAKPNRNWDTSKKIIPKNRNKKVYKTRKHK